MNSFLKAIRLSALALALTAGAASAQTGGGGSTTGGGSGGGTGGTTTTDTRNDRGFDWGLLGLLGLAGLIPLFMRRNAHTTHAGSANHGGSTGMGRGNV